MTDAMREWVDGIRVLRETTHDYFGRQYRVWLMQNTADGLYGYRIIAEDGGMKQSRFKYGAPARALGVAMMTIHLAAGSDRLSSDGR